jgi:hypothetical protein
MLVYVQPRNQQEDELPSGKTNQLIEYFCYIYC